MIHLNVGHPEIWQQLGRQDVTGRFWPLSLRLPIWTWSSLFFFIAKRYEKLGDRSFSTRAAAFRLILVFWLVAFCAGTVLSFLLY